MKGKIQVDHMPVNNYQLRVAGLEMICTKVSGIEDVLETVDLPDRTAASGGNRKSTEMVIEVPAHHLAAQAFLEAWFKKSQDPVDIAYKLPCTLINKPISGNGGKTNQLFGCFPKKRKTPDFEMQNEGELAVIEWTISIDDILPA